MSAHSDDDEPDSQDECFKLLRLIVAVINEYAPVVKDPNSRPGWALTDLRDISHDLLTAIENADEPAVESLLIEARVVLAEVIFLAG